MQEMPRPGLNRKEQSMARYRKYKNGITGCRYKGCYILRGDKKGSFSVLSKDGSPFMTGLYDFEDCRWAIDKAFADREERIWMEELYTKQIYELTAILAGLEQKTAAGGLAPGEDNLIRIAQTVLARKAKNRPF